MSRPQPADPDREPNDVIRLVDDEPDIVRIDDVEDPAPSTPDDTVVPRIATILRTLDTAVERVRAQADADAQQLLDRARRDADRIRASAIEEGRDVVRAARTEAVRLRLEAEDRVTAARVELDRIRSRRNHLVRHLRALRRATIAMAEQLHGDGGDDPATARGFPPPPDRDFAWQQPLWIDTDVPHAG